MRVTEKVYGEITRRIVEAAERHAAGRVLSLYAFHRDAVARAWMGLAGAWFRRQDAPDIAGITRACSCA